MAEPNLTRLGAAGCDLPRRPVERRARLLERNSVGLDKGEEFIRRDWCVMD